MVFVKPDNGASVLEGAARLCRVSSPEFTLTGCHSGVLKGRAAPTREP